MKDHDKWNMKNMDVLNEKDLTCIARILQSVIHEDPLFHHCGCCQHKTECFSETEELHIEYHFLKVREKLQKITGVELSLVGGEFTESIRKKMRDKNKNTTEKTIAVDSVDKTIEIICNYIRMVANRGLLSKRIELIKALAELITARNSQPKIDIDELGEMLFKKIDAAISNVGEITENFKLTNQEREFCKVIGHGYIARDQDGILNWHESQPIKFENLWIRGINVCELHGDIFKFIKWEDAEPWSVEELLGE
ncbi:MAG: hypothetical protein HFE90_03270 [Firmicutes bacterium]|nr:hypothetical protein [Bacillota bacterium]